MTVQEKMTPHPTCCVPTDTAARAAQLMRTADVGSVPIVKSHSEKKLVGIITDRDLALEVVASGRDANTTRLQDIMTEEPVTCRVDDDYEDVVRAMSDHQIRRIPVVDDNDNLVGIVSQADIALTEDAEEVADLVEDISKPGRGAGSRRGSSRRRESSGSSWNTGLLVAGGVGLGVGLLYLLDPNRGAARRTAVKDKANELYNRTGELVTKATDRTTELVNKATQEVKDRVSSVTEDKPSLQNPTLRENNPA